MTGPEHYKLAEEHLAKAKGYQDVPVVSSFHLKVADLHAQLAQAAALALEYAPFDEPSEDWREAIS